MSTTGHQSNIVLSGAFLIVVSTFIMYCIATYKIYVKTKDIMEPMHVFQLNHMAVISSRASFSLIAIGHQLVGSYNDDSCFYYFFGFFTLFCLNTDVFLMQIDRFLAVYWNLKYKSRITTKMALRSCIASKLFAIIVTILVASLDQKYSQCVSTYLMLDLKNSNIYLDAYPKIFVACVLLVVSIYVGITMRELEKKIHPLVNLPTLPTVPSVSFAFQDQGNGQQARNNQGLSKVQRKDEDPNMFYEVKIESERREGELRDEQDNEEEITIQCFNPNKEIFLVAKAALTMNFLLSVYFIVIVPNRILAIIYQNCNEVSGDCDSYMLLNRILTPFRVLFTFLHPVLILKKIDKI